MNDHMKTNNKIDLPDKIIQNVKDCIDRNNLDISVMDLIVEGINSTITGYDESITDEEEERARIQIEDKHTRSIMANFSKNVDEKKLREAKQRFIAFLNDMNNSGYEIESYVVSIK